MARSGPVAIASQDVAMGWIIQLLALVNGLLADRSRLALENVILRSRPILVAEDPNDEALRHITQSTPVRISAVAMLPGGAPASAVL